MSAEQQPNRSAPTVAEVPYPQILLAMIALFMAILMTFVAPRVEPILGVVAFSIIMLGIVVGLVGFYVVYLALMKVASLEIDDRDYTRWYVRLNERLISASVGEFYAAGVRRTLAALDDWLGDAGREDDGLFQRAFGLRVAAPLWTAQSFDRCLLVALCYPLVMVIVGWAWTGESGPLEMALGFGPTADVMTRVFTVSLILLNGGCLILFTRWSGLRRWIALTASLTLTSFIIFTFAGRATEAGIDAGILAVLMSVFVAKFGANAIAVIAIGVFSVARAAGGAETGRMVVAYAAAIGIFAIAALLLRSWPRYGKHLLRIVLLSALLLAIYLAAPLYLHAPMRHIGQPEASQKWALTFFLGVLTLANAPIDWLAIGLTRALLRMGIERRGPFPIVLAVLDVAISLILMAILAGLTLCLTEIFNAALLAGGWGAPFVDPRRYLEALGDPHQRGRTEYWWLWTMLFSTQIPALLNLAFGSFCLLRGFRWVSRSMAISLLNASANRSVTPRIMVAAVFGLQMGLGLVAGFFALYAMARTGLWLIDGLFGASLLDRLRQILIMWPLS